LVLNLYLPLFWGKSMWHRKKEQAWAELCQAQFKLGSAKQAKPYV
jgi:hypothetical protein